MEEQILAVDLSTEQTLEVNLPEQDNVAQIDVYWQDEVVLDLDASLMYIVSGQQEIQDYVENTSKPEINRYIDEYAKPIVSEVIDQIATPIIDEYFENTVKPSITEFAEEEMAGYAATATAQVALATEQAGIATEKADEASETAKIVDEKVQEFSQTTEASKTEFANFAQEKTEEFEQTAITATEQAVGSAEHARIWAEGEQAEVQELGGELSSKGWANLAKESNALAAASASQSASYASASASSAKESADYAELAKQYGNDKLNQTNITNCITEIPQDIKLELVDGVLTLKAGSKVYVPNGFEADGVTPKFDEVVVESDVIGLQWGTVTASNISEMYNPITKDITPWEHLYSGSTAPTQTFCIWYDTTNNLVKWTADGGASWGSGMALPLSLSNYSNGSVTSINQVFNGFGYIGSTIFALPGVKGLIPNGRNADGSLRNIEFTVNKHTIRDLSEVFTTFQGITIFLKDTGDINLVSPLRCLSGDFINIPKTLSNTYATVYYATDVNKYYSSSGSTTPNWEEINQTKIANALYDGEKIISFTPKTTFRAVDYNSALSLGMPSSRYIDLTLGSSGTTYTAPVNGYVVFGKAASGAGQYINLSSGYITNQVVSNASSNILSIYIPVAKGHQFKANYSVGGATNSFRFIYAKGEE